MVGSRPETATGEWPASHSPVRSRRRVVRVILHPWCRPAAHTRDARFRQDPLVVAEDLGQPDGDDRRLALARLLQAAAQGRTDLAGVAHALAVSAGRLGLLGEVDRRVEVAALEPAPRGVALGIEAGRGPRARAVAAVLEDD